MRRGLFGLIGLMLLAGCPSLSTMQTPSTVPKGGLRFGVGFEAVGYKEGSGSVSVPQTEFSVRYGVTDDIDVGAKAYFIGTELGAKYQFLRGAFDAAIAPAVSYISINTGGGDTVSTLRVAYLHLPLLFGYNVSDRFTIGFGPKALYSIATGSASNPDNESSVTSDGFMAGGYGQLAFRIGDAFWVAPELNVYKPFTDGSSGIVYQGGLVFLFGGGPQPAMQPQTQPAFGPPGGNPSL